LTYLFWRKAWDTGFWFWFWCWRWRNVVILAYDVIYL